MASSFTDILRLEKMVQGEQSNQWGDVTTDNLIKLERAVGAVETLTLAAADYTLSTASGGDGTTSGEEDEASALILNCVGTLSVNIDIIAPNQTKMYIIYNNTDQGASETVSIKTAAGSALEIPNGETHVVWCDGNDNFFGISASISGTVALSTNALQLGGVVAAAYALLTPKQSFINPQTVLGQDITLTDNAFIPDADTNTTMYLAQSEVSANYTIENPIGTPISGQILIFQLEQSSGTPRSITWGSEYVFTDDIDVDLTQTINTIDTFTCQWNPNTLRWMMAGVAQNFPRV